MSREKGRRGRERGGEAAGRRGQSRTEGETGETGERRPSEATDETAQVKLTSQGAKRAERDAATHTNKAKADGASPRGKRVQSKSDVRRAKQRTVRKQEAPRKGSGGGGGWQVKRVLSRGCSDAKQGKPKKQSSQEADQKRGHRT